MQIYTFSRLCFFLQLLNGLTLYSSINTPDNKTSDKCKATLAASAQQKKS